MAMPTLATLSFLQVVFFGLLLKTENSRAQDGTQTCQQIAQTISSASSVYWPGSPQYANDISHWANSSSALAVCSVEPGTATDVGRILRVLSTTRTSFGVKGGGHAYNPGFSSSTAVEISLRRFNSVVYNSDTQTADVGPGLVCDDVYAALEAYNVTVVGARGAGIGVAGVALGGGYSFLTNERGLASDNIAALELALPNGEVVTINETSNQDLFHAIKGGYNNFGIVTKFTFKTFPQGPVWGGYIAVAADYALQVQEFTARYAMEVTDPKAALQSGNIFESGELLFVFSPFYNGPNDTNGIFDDLLSIPAQLSNIATQSYTSLIRTFPSAASTSRALSCTAPILELTPAMIDAVQNETAFWGNNLLNYDVLVSIAMEPFLPTILSHASVDSASYPPSREKVLLPLGITFNYDPIEADAIMYDACAQSAAHLTQVARSLGQDVDAVAPYGNYALAGMTTAEDLWRDKLPFLKGVKAKFDPEDVMGLTGGWKI